ncbi:MAG: sigma-54-dependent Fis family transcriptional regulator [Hyphomicrobium denitrificans]|nr:sigma-54-dependent Fis family transcriptional regulator [Hyphomicrobium denitrificans]
MIGQNNRNAHVADVIKATEGDTTNYDSIITDSWRRCIQEHQLNPVTAPEVYVHTSAQLRERQQRMEDILRTARFGLETLHRQIAGLGYTILLTDAQGITIDFIGDPAFETELRHAGLYLGAEWSESLAGTNGVGTCIANGKGLIVHQGDHFSANHINLTCTAVPIFDPQGQIAAVLDISALRSPEEKQSQHLALALVTHCAHQVENATLFNHFNRNWILKFSSSPEFLCVDPEYVLALDEDGLITGFNNRTALLLRHEFGLAPVKGGDLKGRAFEDVFDCTLEKLGNFARLSHPRATIKLKHSGTILFLQAIPPTVSVRGPASTSMPKMPEPLANFTKGDPAVVTVLERAAKLADAPISLLIQGETGTGKEYFARAVHDSSARSHKEFVAINCAAFPESLIESELFGYEAGAFTGAQSKGKQGLVAQANGGTLFLDEIGDMPLMLQTRLLRVLAEREIIPVGATRPIKLDVRVIAATHRNLTAMIKTGQFREDLYYRLNGFELILPALRDRSDIEWLIERLIRLRCPTAPPVLTPEAASALYRYRWPGNVRELKNVLDFALAVCSKGVVSIDDLPSSVLGMSMRPMERSQTDDSPVDSEAASLRTHLARRHWNVTQVARDLNVDRTTIHRRMKRFGIVAPNQCVE